MFSNLSDKEVEAVKLIRNFILHQGRTPSVRELMKGLNYKSPRSASVLFNMLEEKDVLKKKWVENDA